MLTVSEWPESLLFRRFEAREVTMLTGVSQDRQRLIGMRYFDYRESIKPEGGRRRWNWAGVQRLAIFDAALGHLGGGEKALRVIRSDDMEMLLDFDLREHPQDHLIFMDLTIEKVEVVDPDRLARIFNGHWVDSAGKLLKPDSAYIYNVTALQRRLCARLGLDTDRATDPSKVEVQESDAKDEG
ncbi:hypothetical protein [Sphingomonas sanguinis]